MPVLMEVRNASGVVGKCDARCYEARSDHCNCVCGGANHGIGLYEARQQTAAKAGDWMQAYRDLDPEAYMPVGVQRPLF